MVGGIHEVLASIATVGDMVAAFQDEERCRRLLEAMIWPSGRLCPLVGAGIQRPSPDAMSAGKRVLACISARTRRAGFSSR